MQDIWVARIEFQRSHQFGERLLPSALSLIDCRAPDQNVRVIWQHPAGHRERAARLFKIADAVIITRLRESDFAQSWTQSHGRLDGVFCLDLACRRVIEIAIKNELNGTEQTIS